MSEVKGAFVLVVILVFAMAGSGMFNRIFMSKECINNSDCSSENYCGSDFNCHGFPKIENTIIKNDWTTPAAILGLAIVIAAFILRRKQPEFKQFYR